MKQEKWLLCPICGNKTRLKLREDTILEKEQFSAYLEKINYDLNKKFILEQQISQMKDSLLGHETYFHKKPAFRHEGEYRLLIVQITAYIVQRGYPVLA